MATNKNLVMTGRSFAKASKYFLKEEVREVINNGGLMTERNRDPIQKIISDLPAVERFEGRSVGKSM